MRFSCGPFARNGIIRRFCTAPKSFESRFNEAAEAIQKGSAILITAGAGMGVDSGLPDFRGNEGFWKAYPPLQQLGLSFQQIANPRWFVADPSLAWGFYGHRLQLYRDTVPHNGFTILSKISKVYSEDQKREGIFVFTTNVDGQFQKAGFDANRIVECHGSIHHMQCITPDICNSRTRVIKEMGNIQVLVDMSTFRADVNTIPRCPSGKCDRIARPNILMFGDYYWLSENATKQEEDFQKWREKLTHGKLVAIDVGSGTAIPTARRTSQDLVRENNGTLIRINVREPEVPSGLKQAISFPMGAREALEGIYRAIGKNWFENKGKL